MSSSIHIGGMKIEFADGKLTIMGIGTPKDTVITRDKIIKGDVEGNIVVKGRNIKVVVMGYVEGNIIGGNVQVKGDVEGNIIGGNVRK